MGEYIRLNLNEAAPQLSRAQAALHDKAIGFLDPRLAELVVLRASQLNGCAHDVDTDTTNARRGGESDRRLHAVALWRDAPFFTAKERAALALTESMTLIAEGQVDDETWHEATEQFSAGELPHLLSTIASINALNRLDRAVRRIPT
ncbi:carboxymuconolactone decarboxylase family protein [Streptomyces sp. CT34]|uniref:carboxymuconolactone decarboxylase family protein n=1 Tax=Streptomyces sp. CT34 TaxID=1553907 RepID=UPI0005BDFE06|nr:carboxymuconolactone decarboxylase family protein [Streptomyces sp. CT34]